MYKRKSLQKTIAKVLTTLLLIGGAEGALTSCGSDDLTGHVPASNTLPIVSNTLVFSAQGGTQAVEVKTTETVTAELSADWCTASVNGSVVSVTVHSNDGYEGRTAVLTLRAGSASRQLPVQQRGSVIGMMPAASRHVSNSGETLTYNIEHDPLMTVTTQSSWIHPSMDGNRLTIRVDDNSGGHIRRGFVASDCGGVRDTMRIAQYSIEDDIVGSYYLAGTFGGTIQATRFDIILRNDSLLMNFTNQNLWRNTYIPVRLDEGAATLIFQSGMVLYNHGSTIETAYFYDTNGSVMTGGDRGACAEMRYVASSGFNQGVMQAYNWPGHELGGFLIRSSVGNGLVVTNLLQLGSPTLTRVGPVGTTLN